MLALIVVFAALCGTGIRPAAATSNVSARFDGIYDGEAVPAPEMGNPECLSFRVDGMVIRQGIFHSTSGAEQPVIGGFITEEGYVSARLARASHKAFPMDGRLEDGIIVAGFIAADEDCDWVLRLQRRQGGALPDPVVQLSP